MPKTLDLTEKVADWVDCNKCGAKGCPECDWYGAILVDRK